MIAPSAPVSGLTYRGRWRHDLLACPRDVTCLEIVADDYLHCAPDRLEELDLLAQRYPILAHGLGLSFGSDQPLDRTRLEETRLLIERVQPRWFSEHLAFTEVPGWSIGHMAPLPFTREAVAAVARNVRLWHAAVGVPLLLENIAYFGGLPGDMSEREFIVEVLDAADCGLLLDLHNLYANSINHRYNPYDFLESLPLDRIEEVHLAGGHPEGRFYFDSHSSSPPDAVWEMLRWLSERVNVPAVVVEWDVDLPPFETIESDVRRAAALVGAAPVTP